REALRGAAALRSRTDRPRGGRPARAGGPEGNRQAPSARQAQRRLRATDRDRRPPERRPDGIRTHRHRAPDGQDLRARGVAVTGALLAVDGDSFAHRAYHSMPKSVRLNAIVGFTNMMLRLWQAERPDVVLVGWDTLEVPT